jgi:hypothetical protein
MEKDQLDAGWLLGFNKSLGFELERGPAIGTCANHPVPTFIRLGRTGCVPAVDHQLTQDRFTRVVRWKLDHPEIAGPLPPD